MGQSRGGGRPTGWLLAAVVVVSAVASLAPGGRPAGQTNAGPVTGTEAVAPTGGTCTGGSQTFPVTETKTGNTLTIGSPGGTSSGPIDPDGKGATTTGPGGTYRIVADTPTHQTITEDFRGCSYQGTITLQQALPLLAETPATNPPAATSPPATPNRSATAVPTTRGTTPASSSGGTSFGWLWGLLLGLGLLMGITGLFFISRLRGNAGNCQELIDACQWARQVAEKRAEELRLDKWASENANRERDAAANTLKQREEELAKREQRLRAAQDQAKQYPPGPGDGQYQAQVQRAAEDVDFWSKQVDSIRESMTMLRESLVRMDDLCKSRAEQARQSQTAWEAAEADMRAKCQLAAACLEEALATSDVGSSGTTATPPGPGQVGVVPPVGPPKATPPSVVPPVVVPHGTTDEVPCHCACSILVRGRNQLLICDCLNDLRWGVKQWEPDPKSSYASIPRTMWNVTLYAAFADGDFFCKRHYDAGLMSECQNGGTIKLTSIDWSVTAQPAGDTVTLHCRGTGVVRCPGHPEREVTCAGELVIQLVKVSCRVSFVIDQDDLFRLSTGHTAVRIQCGEYDTVFGFYPTSDSILAAVTSDLGLVAGKVQEETSRDDEWRDGLGKRLSKYHSEKYRREYYFDVNCRACERLRLSWAQLTAKPGDFQLNKNNCTTAAVEKMAGIVPLPAGLIDDFFSGGTTKSPWHLADLLDKGGVKREDHRPGS